MIEEEADLRGNRYVYGSGGSRRRSQGDGRGSRMVEEEAGFSVKRATTVRTKGLLMLN